MKTTTETHPIEAPKNYIFNPGDCITCHDITGKHIHSTHKCNSFGVGGLSGYRPIDDILEQGTPYCVPLITEEMLQARPGNYWFNEFNPAQETWCLACWLDSRREESI